MGTRSGEVDELHGFVGVSHDRWYWGQVRIVALFAIASCVVVISHDRWFLDRIATHVLAFEGDSKVTFFDGNFSEYEERRRQTLRGPGTRPHRITYRKLTR
jgi:energy-dependent translational throttle protein EttA